MTSTSPEIDPQLTRAAAADEQSDEHASATIVSTRNLQRAQIEATIARDYAGLRALIYRRTGDLQVAADLLNDAIVTAWEKWQEGRIAHPEQIAGYVFQTAVNLMRNHRRIVANSPSRRASSETLDIISAPDSGTEGIDAKVASKVIDIIRKMDSNRDRTVLIRFYLDEDDKESICRDLKLTTAQFTKVLHRARGRLRDLLEAHGLKGKDMFSWVLI